MENLRRGQHSLARAGAKTGLVDSDTRPDKTFQIDIL
jgi:hypothetical protein